MKPTLHLLGDKYKAAKYIRFAERKLAELKDFMKMLDLDIQSRSYRFTAGDSVYIESFLGIDKIRIKAAKEEVVAAPFRALFAGGQSSIITTTIDYVTIDTTMDALSFGGLSPARKWLSSCSDGSRGLFGGGFQSVLGNVDTIAYVTIATASSGSNFGDLSTAKREVAACANDTRGLFGGGHEGSIRLDVIDYVTIATLMNALDFGDLTQTRRSLGAFASLTRGVWGGGIEDGGPGTVDIIDYVTIATTMNALDFGDLTQARYLLVGCSNETRGLFAGGWVSAVVNTIDYVTIATTMNAVDFGDLSIARREMGASASSDRGVFGGGTTSGSDANRTNIIDYVTIATLMNALDFGDLTVSRLSLAGCSGS